MRIVCGSDGRLLRCKEFGVFVMDGLRLRQGDLYACDCGECVVIDFGEAFGEADAPTTFARVKAALETTGAAYVSPRTIKERF